MFGVSNAAQCRLGKSLPLRSGSASSRAVKSTFRGHFLKAAPQRYAASRRLRRPCIFVSAAHTDLKKIMEWVKVLREGLKLIYRPSARVPKAITDVLRALADAEKAFRNERTARTQLHRH